MVKKQPAQESRSPAEAGAAVTMERELEINQRG